MQYACMYVILTSFGGKKETKTSEIGRQLRNRRKSIQHFEKNDIIRKYIFLGTNGEHGKGGGRRGSYSADNTGPELRNHVEISPSPCAHILSAGFTKRQNMALK